jgi:hypothetical protein
MPPHWILQHQQLGMVEDGELFDDRMVQRGGV